MSTWQPIDTAPKDGTHLMLLHTVCGVDYIETGYYYDDHEEWVCISERYRIDATYWMQLPPLPDGWEVGL